MIEWSLEERTMFSSVMYLTLLFLWLFSSWMIALLPDNLELEDARDQKYLAQIKVPEKKYYSVTQLVTR